MQYHIAQPDGSTRMDDEETTAERDRGIAHGYYDSPPCG